MQSSSLDTMASDVFDQDKSPLCWIYSGVNLMLKFIIQTYKTYDKNKNIFEEKGKDSVDRNGQSAAKNPGNRVKVQRLLKLS